MLIADDDALIRDALTTVLKGVDDVAVVGTACNGAQALELTSIQHPDVVLMDISMPVMSGIEATALLTAMHEDVRVLIFSGHAGWEKMRAARDAGASGYIPKGGNPDVIVAALRTVKDGGTAWANGVK